MRETVDAAERGRSRRACSDRAMVIEAIEQADRAGRGSGGSDHPGGGAASLMEGIFPGYEVLREIHRGGQGVVYKAKQCSTGQTVAIKLMHGWASAGGSARSRFEREVHVLAQLDHPGIVHVLDSGQTPDGGLFYVMDYVGGKPLDVIIREWRGRDERIRTSTTKASSRTSALGATELRGRLELFAKVCEGVNAAHLMGVIHRDLKPANVRLDARGEPVVVDFGLAKVAGAESERARVMTTTGQFIGSMPWSSPEQAEGAHGSVDTRSDVYSLGVILYQILTGGRFPYVVIGTVREVMHNILHVEPERPSQIDRGINDEVETIVLKALSKERERRYQTAGELARDVRRYLAGEPIEAKRDSGWYILTKTLSRHRLPVGFIAAIALMTLVFTVVLIGKYTEANVLREQAQQGETVARLAEQQAKIERDRAEENFDAVRDLAHTFMFDFGDKIENLRGATDARALVVTRAADYLARLAAQVEAEAEPREELLREMAEAYDRLGVLRAAAAAANLGNTEGAERSFDRAEAIRAMLIERNPGDGGLWLERGLAAASVAGVQMRRGAFDDAGQTCTGGLAALDRALEFGASGVDVGRARAGLQSLLGDLRHRAARATDTREASDALIAEAMAWYDKAEAWWRVDPGGGGVDPAMSLATLQTRRARSMIERGAWSRRAVKRGADASLLDGGAVSVREALDRLADAIDTFERIRDARPADRDVARMLISARMEQGLGWDTLGAIEQARGAADADAMFGASMASYQSAYASAQTLAADVSDLDAQRLLGVAMNKVGNALRRLGRLDEAELLYEELIELRRAIVNADPVARHRRDLALVIGKRAQIDQIRAEGATGQTREDLLASAMVRYREALGMFEALSDEGVPMDREIAVTSRTIEHVEAMNAQP